MPDSMDDTLAATGTGSESRPALEKPVYRQGESLGRYVVLSKLGEGGMGVVYAAYDPELDRKIAVKVVRPDVRRDETQGGARLLREAQALARLSHPNIVNIYDVGVVDDQVWIAMEFVDGVTLKRWLGERARTWQEVLDVMRAAAVGLSAAHAAGLVHRDFKPDNVMISGAGRVRVMDFGLARQNEASDEAYSSQPVEVPDDLRTGSLGLQTDLTRTGALSGTPRYMSPEQFSNLPAGEASDQFSFCIALWEALYGERPFKGDTPLALSFSVTQGNRQPPPRGSKVPSWLRGVLERGLERDPGQRWPSMGALLEALEASRRRRQRRWGAAAVGIVGLAVAGVVAAQRVEQKQTATACERKASPMRDVWNDGARADLEAALATSDKSFASTTIARVVPALDDYAAQWSELATGSCVAANVDEQLDPEAYMRREMCLESALAGMSTLVDTLSTPESARESIDAAIDAVQGLPPLSRCGDDQRLRLLPSAPVDKQELVQDARLMHARTQARVNLGDMQGALELAEQAVAEANTIGWGPLVAESVAMLGRLQGKLGQREESEASLRKAYFEAASSSADVAAMQIALDLADAVSDDPARLREAEDWYEHAQVFAPRIEDSNRLLEAESLATLAGIRREQGKLDKARELYTQAREIKIETFGQKHPQTAVVTNNLATVIDRQGDQEGARALFKEATDALEERFGPDHPQFAIALNNLATIQAQSGQREVALASFQRALAIQERAFGPESINTAQILINLGQLYGELGDFEGQDDAYTRAIPIFKESLGDKHPVYAFTLTNLAGLRIHQGRLDEAKEAFAEALSIMEATLPPGDSMMTTAIDGLGRVAREQGEHEVAKQHFERSLSLYPPREDGTDHPGAAYSLTHLSEIALERGEFEAAAAHAGRAIAINETQTLDPHELARLRFALARAKAGGEPPSEAHRALAREAREVYAREAERFSGEIAAIDAFIEG